MQELKTNRYFTTAYLLILGIVIGASVYAGAVVAPVTFGSEKWLGSEILSRFQEGLIMTHNFIGLKYFILAGVFGVFIYEGYQYKRFNRDLVKTISALGFIMSSLLFNYFYMSSIIDMQKQGEQVVKSQIFENMHKGSEIALMFVMLFALVLFIRTLQKELK